jgi:tyrosyl-tRNA synthetase
MGKTIDGAIWLNKTKFSDFDFFQYWRNVNDGDVEKYLKLFTILDLKEINKLSKLKNKEINEAKKILAYEVTKICRGKNSADESLEISQNVFDSKLIDSRIKTKKIKITEINNNKFDIIDALDQLELVKSRSDAKRIIKSGGVKINNTLASNKEYSLKNFIGNSGNIKIVVGKKKIGIIKIM